MTAEMRSYRPVIIGARGAVAANHPLAAQAGLLALRAGGNAVDAAVATAMTLGVVEPMMSGLGGDGFYHVYDQATGRAVVFNGTGPAPAAATPERYAGRIPRIGPLSVSVPGTVSGWARCIAASAGCPGATCSPRRSRSPATGLAPRAPTAISPMNTGRRCSSTRAAPQRFSPAVSRRPRRAIVQPDLARTLEEIAAGRRGTFYRGRSRGGSRPVWRRSVFGVGCGSRSLRGREQDPIAIDYRGFTVLEAPPNSTGFVLLQELKILEHFDLAGMGLLSADAVHVMVEAKKLAFADRERWGADPRFVEAPLARAVVRRLCRAARRRASTCGGRRRPRAIAAAAGDTTYFCTADGEGNAVSGVQSINSGFGSGVMAGDTGILLNNRMSYWHLEPGHPNRLQPGRRVRHTMNPPLVLKDGALWCVFGTPGADNQVQINLQVLTAMIDFGLDPQQAAEMPRWTSKRPANTRTGRMTARTR